MFHMKHQKTNERKIFKKIKLMDAYIFALFNFSFLQKRIIQIREKAFQYRCRRIAADTYAQMVHDDQIKAQ